MSIFPSSIAEIDKSIVSFSDNESLRNLSGVNKPANELISNVFFKELFNCQHPALAGIKFEFKYLCDYFPDNCWKIACCAFSRGEFCLSQTFISEYSPNIYKCVKSEKAQVEIELKKICGSGYGDEKSQIHKAWVAHDKIARLANEHDQLISSLKPEIYQLLEQLAVSCPEIEKLVILETASIFSLALQHYTDEQILNPNDQETIAIHDELFFYVRKKAPSQENDESVRGLVDNMISARLPDLNTILTSNPESNNSHLIRCFAKKSLEFEFLTENKGFEDNDIHKFNDNYKRLEKERANCVDRLRKIERKLTDFGPSGKITLTRTLIPWGTSGEVHCHIKYNEKIAEYFNILHYEFSIVQVGEIAMMRLPSLEKCLGLIRQLIKQPETASPDTFECIRQMINSLSDEDMDYIWGTLYHQCANGIQEIQWSEKHFHEFLPDLMELVDSRYQTYYSNHNWLNDIIKDPMHLIYSTQY